MGERLYTLRNRRFTVPEVVLLDPVQMQRAIADPFGYRDLAATAGEPASWSLVKRLFR